MWLERLLTNLATMFIPAPDSMLVLYKKYQDRYCKWERTFPNVRCMQGLRKDLLETGSNAINNTLLILDDWMNETITDPFFMSLYTAGTVTVMSLFTVHRDSLASAFPPWEVPENDQFKSACIHTHEIAQNQIAGPHPGFSVGY